MYSYYLDGLDFEETLDTAPQLIIIDPVNARSCLNIQIFDDIINEETESFRLELEFGREDDETSVRFEQDTTEIFITDNDG